MTDDQSQGRGWHGDPAGHAKAGSQSSGNKNAAQNLSDDARSKGGQVSSSKQDMSALGSKGGQAAQQSGHAHQLTDEERSKGGSMSGGNFANDPERARDAGQKGGSQ